MKRYFFNFLIIFTLIFPCFAQFNEEAYILKTYDFRQELCCLEKIEDRIVLCDERLEEAKALYEAKQLSLEGKITADNIIGQEKANAYYAKDINTPVFGEIITGLYREIKNYMEANPNKIYSKYFYETSADIISSSLQFLPVSKAMNEGVKVKSYYDSALAQDPDFSVCLANQAQWYYYAPSVAGGSKKIAKELMEKSVKTAKSKNDIYYCNMILSQMLFEEKNMTEYAKVFAASRTASSDYNYYLDFVQKLNKGGYSILFYPQNRAKIDKTLGL